MPTSNPTLVFNKIALVKTRPMIKGEDHGMCPFIVPIRTTREPYSHGILSICQPLRSGASPLDLVHDVLQVQDAFESPRDAPPVSPASSMLHISVANTLRRHVAHHGEKIPIFTFTTQQWFVLAAARVLEAWYREVTPIYSDSKATDPIKHALTVLVKTTDIRPAHR
ncbi:hypothetical protein V8E53_000155 [Lactarius tabidus]